jgi:hypothetical protein
MAITTYAELKTALANWSERSDLTSLMPDFITYAHQEIGRGLRSTTNTLTANVTINAETVAVPTYFKAIRRLYLDLTPRRRLMVISPEGRQDMASDYQAQTYPTHVSVEGASFGFAPVPTGTVTGKLLYYTGYAPMSADSDTNAVLTAYPFLYLHGALSALYSYIMDDAQEAKFEGKFRGLMADINARESMDAMSGPLQSVPYPGGVV